MWTILDYMIIGILIAVTSFVFRIIFKLSEKIQMGIFIILFGFIFFTDYGKDIRSELAFFDKSNTWTDTGKNTLAYQCSAFTFKDMTKISFTENEKEKIGCCMKNIMIKKSQDDYFQLKDTFILITDTVKSCDK